MLRVLAQAAEQTVVLAAEPVVWRDLAVRGGAAIALAVVVTLVGRWYMRRVRRKAKNAPDELSAGRRLRRRSTLTGLIVGTIQIVVWFTVLIVILDELGVPLGALFASAGVVGVALGFGAQTIVRDTLSGLFIALEGQFDVGDIVDVQSEGGLISGTIESLTLRVTTVRQFDGTLSTVPNGGIQVVSNKTRGWGRAIVDIRVALDEDPEKVRATLEEVIGAAAAVEPLKGWLRAQPMVLGVTQLTDIAQVIRVVAETVPNHRVDTERELRGKIAQRIGEKGIRVPPVGGIRPASSS